MLLHWPDITVTENPDPAIAAAVKAAVDPLNAQIASLNAQIATLTANANSANAALSAARLSLSKWDAFKKLLSELVGNIPQ
jgi:multidrug resistance efflux pump